MTLQDPFFARPVSERGTARAATRMELILAALIAFVVALPFADKAVTQDDWAYLTIAEYAAEDGEALLARETLYQGRPITVAQGMLHGPVWIGVLAGCRLLGEDRLLPAARLVVALLLGLLAAATTALAARLGAPPLATGLALAFAPGPLLLAGTAMTDLPMLAFFVAALSVAAAGDARRSVPLLVAAGFLGALAALTRYYGAAVVPLLAVQPFLFGTVRLRSFIPAASAGAGLCAWLVLSSVWLGEADTARGLAVLEELPDVDRMVTFLAAVCGLGGMAAGWLAAGLAAPRKLASAVLSDPLVLFIVLGGLAVGAWLAIDAALVRGLNPRGANGAMQTVFLCFGATLLLSALRPWMDASAWRRGGLAAWRAARGGEAWLTLWLGGFLVAATMLVPFGAARYVLPALPAAVLLCALFTVRRLGLRATQVGLIASAALGLSCAVADENASEIYARYGQKIGARRAPGGPWNETGLWVWGELGFRWYLERDAAGLVLGSRSNDPVAGDRILRSALCTASTNDGRSGKYTLAPTLLPRMYAEDHEVHTDAWPIRVHNPQAGAGFYHSRAGLLPFAFSRVRHDEFQTWLVKDPSPFIEAFREAALETVDEPRLVGGNIRVERFAVLPDLPTFPAVKFHFPGRATWRSMHVPAELPWLTLHVGEHYRVALEGAEGPGVVARVLVNGEVVYEQESDVRRNETDRVWFDASIDLSRWAGSEVAITFEVEAGTPGSAPDGSPPVTIVGFADPRFSPQPFANPGNIDRSVKPAPEESHGEAAGDG